MAQGFDTDKYKTNIVTECFIDSVSHYRISGFNNVT